MKEEKFKVINFIRELIIYLDKYLDNFPKKDIEIKSQLRNSSYKMLELAYKANIKNVDNVEYINSPQADFFMENAWQNYIKSV